MNTKRDNRQKQGGGTGGRRGGKPSPQERNKKLEFAKTSPKLDADDAVEDSAPGDQ